MDFSIENFDELGRRISFTVSSAEFESRVAEEIDKQSKGFKAKGFRPGKVPRKEVKRRIGTQIRHRVADELAATYVKQALDEHGWEPLEVPRVEIGTLDQGKDVTFTTEIETRPEITFDAIGEIQLRLPKIQIDEDFFHRAYFRLLRRLARWDAVDGPAQLGDIVEVQYLAAEGVEGEESGDADVETSGDDSQIEGESLSVEHDEWPILKLDVGNPDPDWPLARKLNSLILDLTLLEPKRIEVDLSDTVPRTAIAAGKPQTMRYHVVVVDIERPELPKNIRSEECLELGYPSANDELTLKKEFRKYLEQTFHERTLDFAAPELVPAIVETVGISRPRRYLSTQVSEMEEFVQAFDQNRNESVSYGQAAASGKSENEDARMREVSNDGDTERTDTQTQRQRQFYEESIWQKFVESHIVRAFANQNGLEVDEEVLRSKVTERLVSRARKGQIAPDEEGYQELIKACARDLMRYQALEGLLKRVQVEHVSCTATQFEEAGYELHRIISPERNEGSD